MRAEIIDNTKYCKKHNLIHSNTQDCPHCFKEAKEKEQELMKKKKSRSKKK